MGHRMHFAWAAVLVLGLPVAMFADITGTTPLSSGQELNLNSGSTGTSGGDIQWTGSAINFVGSAKGFDLPGNNASTFSLYTATEAQADAPLMSSNPIPIGSLIVGNLFLMQTNAGSYAKVLVTAQSGTSITLQYDTFASAANAPTITAVLDAGSYTANIAQGSVFVVKGTNLSAAGFVQTSFPLPTSMGGVSISFASPTGGNPTLAYIDYLFNQGGVNQLAAILPSGVAVGTYNVTVTNGGATSAPFSVQVVSRKPGLITADSTGSGLAVLTQNDSQSPLTYDVIRFTTGSVGGFTIAPAHPGQTEVAYLVGSGADPGPDNQASPGYNFLTNGVTASVIVGGTTIPALYLGRVAGGSGYEQVNFTLPANITTGCTVSFQIVENGVASQGTFISIAPSASATACVQPGYTTSQLQQFDNQTLTINAGSFSIGAYSETEPGGVLYAGSSASGRFIQYTGFELSAAPPPSGTNTQSGCTVIQIAPITIPTLITGAGTVLDAGKLTLSGPSGSGLNSAQLPEVSNAYNLPIGGQGVTLNGNIVAGTYTLTGSGGTGVGAFSSTVNLSPLTVTGGLPSTVTLASGLTLNWTGGNPSDVVQIEGFAANVVNNVETGAAFVCYTTAGARGFTIPSSITSQLPSISAAAVANGSGVAALYVTSTTGNLFNAPLTAGGTITNASFGGTFTTSNSPAFQ